MGWLIEHYSHASSMVENHMNRPSFRLLDSLDIHIRTRRISADFAFSCDRTPSNNEFIQKSVASVAASLHRINEQSAMHMCRHCTARDRVLERKHCVLVISMFNFQNTIWTDAYAGEMQ